MTLNYDPTEVPSDFGSGSTKTQQQQKEKSKVDVLGLEVATMDTAIAKQLGMNGVEGVVITSIKDGSSADNAGLTPGTVIVQVNRKSIRTVADFETNITSNKDGSVLLLVRTEQGARFVVLSK